MALFDDLLGKDLEKRGEAFGLFSFLKEMEEKEQEEEEEQEENASWKEDLKEDTAKHEEKEE